VIVELRKKSQVTIPKELVQRLGLKEGDKLDITEHDGVISLIPVAVYPKKYIDMIREEVAEIRYKVEAGDKPVFDTLDELFDDLSSEQK
jgi:AbrB family looped-hinge helix DNA binding protein